MATFLRRFALAIGIVLIFASCNSTRYASKNADPFGLPGVTMALSIRCATGVGWDNPNGPVVCVRTGRAGANPDTIHVYDQQESLNRQASGKPVWILWLNDTGMGNPGIRFTETTCTETPICVDNGSCRAKVKMGGGHRQCHYSINVGMKAADPIVVVDPCCGMLDQP